MSPFWTRVLAGALIGSIGGGIEALVFRRLSDLNDDDKDYIAVTIYMSRSILGFLVGSTGLLQSHPPLAGFVIGGGIGIILAYPSKFEVQVYHVTACLLWGAAIAGALWLVGVW